MEKTLMGMAVSKPKASQAPVKQAPKPTKVIESNLDTSGEFIGTVTKSKRVLNDYGRVANAATIESNGVILSVQDAQYRYVGTAYKFARDFERLDQEAMKYTISVLKSCAGPVNRGMNKHTMGAAIGAYTVIAAEHPDIRQQIPLTVYDMMHSLSQELIREYDYYKEYYYAVIGCNYGDVLPVNPTTAALMEIACDVAGFYNIRSAGNNADARSHLLAEYMELKDELFFHFDEHRIHVNVLTEWNQKIAIGLILGHSDPYQYIFTHVYDTTAVNFDEVERGFATQVTPDGTRTVSIYKMPIDGLHYKEGGRAFEYRFGMRLPYNPNVYDDMIYEEIREHFGPIHQAEVSKDNSYLKSEVYLRSQMKLKEYQQMMYVDNYTMQMMSGVMRAAKQRSEMYYYTETDEGRREWAKLNPELATFIEEEQQREAEKPRDTIRIDDPIGFAVARVDEEYLPSYRVQPGMEQPVESFADTMTRLDYVQLAGLMAAFAESVDPENEPYNLEKYFVALVEEKEVFVRKFIEKYALQELEVEQRRKLDMIHIMMTTSAPVLDDANRLVATRAIGSAVAINEIGGVVRGNSSVARGCWVDTTSTMNNSKLSGETMVLMQSSIRNSKIDGVGVIANTMATNSTLEGIFSPQMMREEKDGGSSVAKMLRITDEKVEFGGESPEKEKRAENLRKKMIRITQQYKDRMVDALDQKLVRQETVQEDAVLQADLNHVYWKSEEEKHKKMANTRLTNDIGHDMAAAKQINKGLKQIGVPSEVRDAIGKRLESESYVDSSDLATMSKGILKRHEHITKAIEKAEAAARVEENQKADEAVDEILYGSGRRYV